MPIQTAKAILFPALIAALTVTAAIGCSSISRDAEKSEVLVQRRTDAANAELTRNTAFIQRLVARVKKKVDAHAADPNSPAPTVDVLIISGGGDWGAFGVGYLQGWGKVPASSPMARPEFDVVTGVSTGALIAPFAFLGTNDDLKVVENFYRNPKPDWVKSRGWLYFLPNNISFAEIPGLEREVKDQFTIDMARRLAAASEGGRLLAVNTTNVDAATPRVFDLGVESRKAITEGKTDRLQSIVLASAGIPGAFPYRMIDNEMYVDGGVTGNIIYGGRISEENHLPAQWAKAYPGTKMPKLRYWVLYNNRVHESPQVTAARWPSVVTRSVSMSIGASTVNSIRHLMATAEIARLKHNADIEVHIVAIPDDWTAPGEGPFNKKTMNSLADLGEKMGADPSTWRNDID